MQMNLSKAAIHWARLVLASLLVVKAAAATPSCPMLEHRKLDRQLDYLRGDRAGLRSECIEFAIDKLGSAAYVPAARVLTTFLDFRVIPPKSLQDNGLRGRYRLPWLGDEYPAATALFEIGLRASDSLVKAIGDAVSSEIIRDNAGEVLRALQGDNAKAVAILILASKEAPDVMTASRLHESAVSLSRKCVGPEGRSACEAALN